MKTKQLTESFPEHIFYFEITLWKSFKDHMTNTVRPHVIAPPAALCGSLYHCMCDSSCHYMVGQFTLCHFAVVYVITLCSCLHVLVMVVYMITLYSCLHVTLWLDTRLYCVVIRVHAEYTLLFCVLVHSMCS